MIQIMMLTTFDDDEYVHQALSNGATGYMLKDIPPEELLAAIRAIHSGAVSISPSIMNKLIGKTLMPKTTHAALLADKPPDPTDDEPIEELTEREIGILELIGSGYQNKQIAEKLCLAEQTVKNYISVIYQKIFVSNRFEAIQFINGFKAYRNRPNSLPDTNGPMRKLP
jgi:DNA-binding NarL/FixJ family response regulator